MENREIFERYEKVRKAGKYNMMVDSRQAMTLSGLNREQYLYVLNNYDQLRKESL